jgi:hypothetical protein
LEKSQNRTQKLNIKDEDVARPSFCQSVLDRRRVQSSLVSRWALLPCLIGDVQHSSRGFPLCCDSCRILGDLQKNWPVVTAHANVTSHEPEREHGGNPLPPLRGRSAVDFGAPAVGTILEADSSHFFIGRVGAVLLKTLDALALLRAVLLLYTLST